MINKKSANIPFKEHEVDKYERRRYRGIDQRLIHGREMRILRRILHKIGPSSLPVLDIPCGYGRFSKLLQEKGLSLVSSDLSFHMVKRTTEKHEDPEGILGDVVDAKKGLPFKRDVFFLLLSMRFFHHIHEKDEREVILKKFFRITSDWVILSYYQRNLIHVLQRKLRRQVTRKKTKIKTVSRREFHEEIRGAGLKVVKVFPVFRGMHAHHIALLWKI